jgi:hypothetical protein
MKLTDLLVVVVPQRVDVLDDGVPLPLAPLAEPVRLGGVRLAKLLQPNVFIF